MRLTKTAAVKMVDEIIAEVGASHCVSFKGCMYFGEPKKEKAKRPPSCLVGHVFYRAGIRYSDLKNDQGFDWPNQNSFSEDNNELLGLLKKAGLTFTPQAVRYLEGLQDYQDGGTPWGECQKKVTGRS